MSSNTKLAVILAAGRGLRFGPQGKIVPKGLIEVGGVSLIERSIGFLLSSGIQRIIIVTGHLAHTYVDRLGHIEEIQFIFNPDFAGTGSMQSLSLCDHLVAEDFILLDSDIIYEPEILHGLLAHNAENSIAISFLTQAGDEVWVQGTENRVTSLRKKRDEDGDPLLGEFTGISKVSRVMLDNLLAIDSVEKPMRSSEYEEFFTAAAVQVEIKPVDIKYAKWGEVDTTKQLERVHREFSSDSFDN